MLKNNEILICLVPNLEIFSEKGEKMFKNEKILIFFFCYFKNFWASIDNLATHQKKHF